MDPVITAVYVDLVHAHGASVDDILIEPPFRNEFLSNCRRLLGTEVGEAALLRRLFNLRKQSKLPRSNDLLAARLDAARPESRAVTRSR